PAKEQAMSDYLLRGQASHVAWSGYWWPMFSSHDRDDYMNLYDEGGPLDKYDEYCVASGLPNPRSKEFEGWRHFADKRLENATGYTAFWWGHCNGWAAASVLENEPTTAREVKGITFEVGDQKGLLTVCHNGDPVDVIRKLGDDDAHLFHAMLVQSIGKEKRGLIFDTKLDPIDPKTGEPVREVWNYPAYRYEFIYTEQGPKTWDVTAQVWFANDAVEPNFVGVKNWPIEERPKVYTYRIVGSQENPTSGYWIGGLDVATAAAVGAERRRGARSGVEPDDVPSDAAHAGVLDLRGRRSDRFADDSPQVPKPGFAVGGDSGRTGCLSAVARRR
ncbi:MAG TPA: hypothetical protein PKW11_07645, partial [Pseudomonadota bacterium]|nr:hypothetical protein [Pseudomonadota bacterium]